MAYEYATHGELKDRIKKLGTASDHVIDAFLDAAKAFINDYYNRPDGFIALTTATARLYAGSGTTYQRIDDCIAVTALGVKDSATDSTYTSWASSDYILFSGSAKNPNFNKLPYTGLMIDPNGDYSHFTGSQFTNRRGFRPMSTVSRNVPTVQVTAKWGYSATVPPLIKEITIAMATVWFKQSEGAWADTLSSVELGQLLYQKENNYILGMLKRGRFKRPNVA